MSLAKIGVDMGISSLGVVDRLSGRLRESSDDRRCRIDAPPGMSGALDRWCPALFLLREQVSRLASGTLSCLIWVALCNPPSRCLNGRTRLSHWDCVVWGSRLTKYFGAALGARLSIPIAYVWGSREFCLPGSDGGGRDAHYLVVAPQIQFEAVKVPPRQIATEGQPPEIGSAFVLTGLMSMGALFLLRPL